jgi:hypothetical protein
MKNGLNVEDIILNYDPAFPQQRFIAAGLEGALGSSTGRLPSTVPWLNNATALAVPLDPAPSEFDDLTRLRGYDAVVVTWAAAEADALTASRPTSLDSTIRSTTTISKAPALARTVWATKWLVKQSATFRIQNGLRSETHRIRRCQIRRRTLGPLHSKPARSM